MPTELTHIQLKFNCGANWDEMQQLNGCRFCSLCQKNVYDFTGSTREEYEQVLFENNNRVCGRFTTKQTTMPAMVRPFWIKWASAAMILLGFNFWTGQAVAQKVKPKPKKVRQIKFPPPVMMGDVQVRPATASTIKKIDSTRKESNE
jgi:hypothetical protein